MNKKAFTLMEMMIAIGIFSIGILTVLHLLINNLYFLGKAETETQASFLAKEGIELMYNLRDSNLLKQYPRDCIPKDGENTLQMGNNAFRNNHNSEENLQLNKEINQICKDRFGYKGNNDKDSKDIAEKRFSIRLSPEGYYSITSSNENTNNENINTRDSLFDQYAIYPQTGKVKYFSDKNIVLYAKDKPKTWGERRAKFARYIITKPLIESGNQIKADIVKLESHVLYRNGTKTGEVIFESFIGTY